MSETPVLRRVLADAAEVARRAIVDMGEGAVGEHLGASAVGDSAAVHRFTADLPGYRGWQWAVVVAAPPAADEVTISEVALLPGPDALVPPQWVPWDQRVRSGDLHPGDLLPPPAQDPRLVPGYTASGDPQVDEVALELGFGRKTVLSREGRLDAAQRWADGDFGPDSPMAKAAPSTCGLCGFYLPVAGSLEAAFGVCGNEMSADGHVVHAEYGCGAHSDVVGPTGSGSPAFDAYDDGALDVDTITRTEQAPAEIPETTESSEETVVSDSSESSDSAEAPESSSTQ